MAHLRNRKRNTKKKYFLKTLTLSSLNKYFRERTKESSVAFSLIYKLKEEEKKNKMFYVNINK